MRSLAFLSADPAPVGLALAQQGAAPKAKRSKDFKNYATVLNSLSIKALLAYYLISKKIILDFLHIGQFLRKSILAAQKQMYIYVDAFSHSLQ